MTDAKQDKRKPISPKHREFVNIYLTVFNATEAYDRVYHPKSRDQARANGARLIAKDSISAAIDEALSENAMRPAEVLQRLGDHARGDLGEYMTDDGRVDMAALRASGKTRLVKRFRQTVKTGTNRDGSDYEEVYIDAELYDAQTALVQIGKAHGLFVDKSESTVHHDFGFTADEAAAAQAKLKQWTQANSESKK